VRKMFVRGAAGRKMALSDESEPAATAAAVPL
jgi:hypothetical protein